MKKMWNTPEVHRAGTFAEATRQAIPCLPGDTKGALADDGEVLGGQSIGFCS
jgi:hypothetical protein